MTGGPVASQPSEGRSEPQLTVCPLTGRVGMWTTERERRPQPAPARPRLDPDPTGCPFCTFDDPDERLLPYEATRDRRRWFSLHNIFPPLDGPTGTADLACAAAHDPTLTHDHPALRADWTAMLDVQLQLAARRTDRWSMLTAAVGRSAGASQHHPHGHVLTPSAVPPAVVELQARIADATVLTVLLDDGVTVAERGCVRLVAPPVPLGPLDLWIVPEPAAPDLSDAIDVLGSLIARWVTGVHPQLAAVGAGSGAAGDHHVAPFDAKVVIQPPLPDGTGRWWAELSVTESHAPGVAAVPLIDLRWLPATQAANFRDAPASPP